MSYFVKLFARVFDISLCCCKTRDRYAVRRAGNVVQADCVAELDGRRVAAVFAADAYVKLFVCAFAERYSHIHKLTYACRIKTCEIGRAHV